MGEPSVLRQACGAMIRFPILFLLLLSSGCVSPSTLLVGQTASAPLRYNWLWVRYSWRDCHRSRSVGSRLLRA